MFLHQPEMPGMRSALPERGDPRLRVLFRSVEVDYDYELIKQHISREKIQERPTNMWRYRELLPSMASDLGFQVGFTPLVKSRSARKTSRLRKSG